MFLAEKQQIPILYSFVWQDRSSYPQSIALEASTPNHYATDAVPYFYFIFIIFLIQISYCPSIYYLKTKINPEQRLVGSESE
jgi:hypothetical protein